MVRSRTPSVYTITFALLMIFSAGEAVAFAALNGQQHTDALLSGIGGPQRMRTQRIAFLTEQSLVPGLTAPERAELEDSIAVIRSAQRQIDEDPSARLGIPEANGQTDLENAIDRYAAAATDVLDNPLNARASNTYVLTHRLPLLKALDKAVETVKARGNDRKRVLWAAIASLLVLMAALLAVAWRFVLVPLERHLTASREQFRSLFEDNPEAVITYDLTGRVITANAAALELSGELDTAAAPTTFAASIAQEYRADAALAFARSAAGDSAKLETTIVRSDGARVDVSASLLPSVVDGRIDGVYSISRDVTRERSAQRQLLEQAKRIHELYLVAATAGQTAEEQICRALELGCARLGLEWGFLANVQDGVARMRASVGSGPYKTGEVVRIDKSVVRRAMATNDLLVIENTSDDPVAADPAARSGKLTTFATFPLDVDGASVGAIGFASMLPRATALTASDRDFIRLIGALIAAAIERGEAKARLDAIAFSDPLTGLPNRASLNESIEAIITRARVSDDRFAVHFIDLDGFKKVNDERGHATGDELLRIVASRIRNAIGPNDIAARLGGDEFIILAPTMRSEAAGALANRVIEAINMPVIIDGNRVSVGASIGIACYPGDGADVKSLFGNADRALYRAKSSGRGRFDHATQKAS